MSSQGAADRAAIVALDKERLWHPYTAMDAYAASDPFAIGRAEGAWLHDLDGRSYLDANSSWWVSVLGHAHPRLVRALRDQTERLCHVSLAGTTHEPAARLAAELVELAPRGLARVFLSDDGSTAVEAAVKMAAQFWHQQPGAARKKTRLVALEGAFHGETVGASSLGGVEVFRRPFAGLLFDCLRVGTEGFDETWSALAELLARSGDEIAALVLEPLVQGAAGMRMYPPRLLAEARRLCDEHDVLLVCDEVFTGFGRTGHTWACDHAGVSPDLLCLSKGLGGGVLPIGATLATERVFRGFSGGRDRAFLYGHSYAGNPLAAAVAREVLAVFREEPIVREAARKGAMLARAFERMGTIPGVLRPRALGLIAAIDLAPGPAAAVGYHAAEVEDDVDPAGYLGTAGWAVHEAARRRGVYLRPLGDTVYVCPPLVIDDRDLETLVAAVEEAVREVLANRGDFGRIEK